MNQSLHRFHAARGFFADLARAITLRQRRRRRGGCQLFFESGPLDVHTQKKFFDAKIRSQRMLSRL
jgi:predicted ATPase